MFSPQRFQRRPRRDGGGTDEKVRLTFGVDGILLGSISIPGGGGRFEKGSVDHFVFDARVPFGHANSVNVSISNTGTPGPEWFCAHIAVVPHGPASNTGGVRNFSVQDWIRPGEPSKRYRSMETEAIEIEFEPAETLALFDETTGLLTTTASTRAAKGGSQRAASAEPDVVPDRGGM